MKNTLNVLLVAISLLIAQACGKRNNEALAETNATVIPTPAEKRAEIERQRVLRTEKWRVEHEKLARQTPSYIDANGNLVYNKPEADPIFVGGNKAMMTYLKDNMKFPKGALDKQEEGLVFVNFIVAKNGMVRDVEVSEQTNEAVDPSLRSEAARVVSSMPKWIPGRQNGKAVDVKFSVPISFQIQQTD